MADSPERKLTAEEKAAQDAGAAPKAETPARASKPGTVRLAPPPFVDSFQVGDTVLTAEGVDLDEATAGKVRAAAEQSGLTLREV
jgi:hypothetical protein